jgi:hypothetical protein
MPFQPSAIHRRRAVQALAGLAAIVLFCALLGDLYYLSPFGILFDFLHWISRQDVEGQFVQLLTVASAALLFVVARRSGVRRDGLARYWWTLTALFVLMVLVKIFPIYRDLVARLRALDDEHAGLQRSSTILFAIASTLALTCGFYFWGFLARLPPRLRWALLAAGGIFLFGSIGMEGIGEWIWGLYHSSRSIPYVAADFFEEVFEVAGLIVFIHALVGELGADSIPPARSADRIESE